MLACGDLCSWSWPSERQAETAVLPQELSTRQQVLPTSPTTTCFCAFSPPGSSSRTVLRVREEDSRYCASMRWVIGAIMHWLDKRCEGGSSNDQNGPANIQEESSSQSWYRIVGVLAVLSKLWFPWFQVCAGRLNGLILPLSAKTTLTSLTLSVSCLRDARSESALFQQARAPRSSPSLLTLLSPFLSLGCQLSVMCRVLVTPCRSSLVGHDRCRIAQVCCTRDALFLTVSLFLRCPVRTIPLMTNTSTCSSTRTTSVLWVGLWWAQSLEQCAWPMMSFSSWSVTWRLTKRKGIGKIDIVPAASPSMFFALRILSNLVPAAPLRSLLGGPLSRGSVDEDRFVLASWGLVHLVMLNTRSVVASWFHLLFYVMTTGSVQESDTSRKLQRVPNCRFWRRVVLGGLVHRCSADTVPVGWPNAGLLSSLSSARLPMSSPTPTYQRESCKRKRWRFSLCSEPPGFSCFVVRLRHVYAPRVCVNWGGLDRPVQWGGRDRWANTSQGAREEFYRPGVHVGHDRLLVVRIPTSRWRLVMSSQSRWPLQRFLGLISFHRWVCCGLPAHVQSFYICCCWFIFSLPKCGTGHFWCWFALLVCSPVSLFQLQRRSSFSVAILFSIWSRCWFLLLRSVTAVAWLRFNGFFLLANFNRVMLCQERHTILSLFVSKLNKMSERWRAQ